MLVFEWRSTVTRVGPPVLAATRPEGANYRSMFAYPSSTAELIRKQGNMKNLDGKMVYCDTILIDIDKEEHVQEVHNIIESLGYGYTMYTTGNRGRHYHIPIKPIQGVNVVYSVKHWLQSVGLWNLIDNSVYRPAGQFRAIGAKHQRTGKLKQAIGSKQSDKILSIALLSPPPVARPLWQLQEGTPESKFNFYLNLLAERGCGQRHQHMYIVFKSAQQAGLDRETAEDCVRWWNATFAETPHSDAAVERKLKGMN